LAHVAHKLSNSMEGALAGGGDPATSPLYVFGPFLKLIVVAGVAQITFGASLWLVIFTIAMVSAMYRLVMTWVVDGSGGSGLTEEEFGGWAVKINAGITFVEYTLTFLVSMAALVTFLADRLPVLDERILGIQYRTFVAIALSIGTGWLVNRGPKAAARAFGPATAGVLLLLWIMIIATVLRFGVRFPDFNPRAFAPENIGFTFGGYARILAVMTGIEIFANLVAAYEGPNHVKSRKAFGSLLIIMGTTSLTMLIVGPAILELSDPTIAEVSVFTQTMDQLLPAPLPWVGTLIGVAVLLSASAASAQGLQNLALGLKYRHYVPAFISERNRFDVATMPVWIEVGIVTVCFLLFGTNEETYLAIYAAGVFILLSMTGWAASKRLLRGLRENVSAGRVLLLAGVVVAALLTTGAIGIIFAERFTEGAWTYLIFLPVLYVIFSWFRLRLGDPTPMEERLALQVTESKYLLPFQREDPPDASDGIQRIIVPLDGSVFAERVLPMVQTLCQRFKAELTLVSIQPAGPTGRLSPENDFKGGNEEREAYLKQIAMRMEAAGISTSYLWETGRVAHLLCDLALDTQANLIAMTTHGRTGLERFLIGSVAEEVVRRSTVPVLLIRPTDTWRSRWSEFKRILITLDGSDASEGVLPYLSLLTPVFDSQATLLAVPDSSHAEIVQARLEDYLQQVRARLNGQRVETVVTGTNPQQTIISMSKEGSYDLLMIATHGRGGVERLLVGSVALSVIREVECPAFVVPIK